MRKYESIWEALKKADTDVWVSVAVQQEAMIQTIVNMVQLEKSKINVARKKLDLPSYGKLEIKRDAKNLKVHFRLRNSGANF